MSQRRDFKQVIQALGDMRIPGALEAIRVLRGHQVPTVFTLEPANEIGEWWIGPVSRERLYSPKRKGIEFAWQALHYPYDRVTAKDYYPKEKEPENACRNAIKCGANWIATLEGCQLLAEAIRKGISINGGVVRYYPDKMETKVQIITRTRK